MLAIIVALYGVGIAWLRRLARFDQPQRLLGVAAAVPSAPAAEPETVAAWRGGAA